MTKRYRIRGADLDALATGGDDALAVDVLRRSQHSRRLLLLRAVLDQASDMHPVAARTSQVDEAFELLTRAQAKAPSVVEDVLLYPTVGSWAAISVRRMRAPTVSTDTVTEDLRHLSAVAASAALQASHEFQITVPVRGNRVVLPMLGTADLPQTAANDRSVAVLRHRAGRTSIRCGSSTTPLPRDLSRDAPGWRALPRLSAGNEGAPFAVCLDDTDPYRDYPGLTPATRLQGATLGAWSKRFDESWGLLARHHARLAPSIAAGLRSLVPLDRSEPLDTSATSSEAFGAAAVSLPESGVDLAVTMVHEVQHSKLGALLNLVPFFEERTDGLFYAPWRDDPRPIGGLLHGCYAYFGITGFWRTQRRVAAGERDAAIAHFEFARWREATSRTAQLLAGSAGLTTHGRRFVDGMGRSLAQWRLEDVPPSIQAAARMAALDHWTLWRLRNLRPDQSATDQLARARFATLPCPVESPVPSVLRPGTFTPVDSARVKLLRASLRMSSRPVAARASLAGITDLAESADMCLIAGDHAAAAAAYRTAVAADPTRLEPWAGLVVAQSEAGEVGADGALRRCPELVLAVHESILSTYGVLSDPEALAAWLAPVVG